jgi:SAM-dependent methyltransferase
MPDTNGLDAEEQLRRVLTVERYPRSSTYDQRWVVDNLMGPHPLWAAEALTQVMPLRPGMRVLDLGCGTALTSIFLAREYDVQVWAVDLWVEPTDNWGRIQQAGVADRVHPIHADAHSLPFADGFFDAIVSLDAFHYFGTDALYLAYCVDFLRPGGSLGIVAPGLRRDPGRDRTGGAGTGSGPVWWRSTSPTWSPAAGRTGCAGWTPASWWGEDTSRTRRCCVPTVATCSASPVSWPTAPDRNRRSATPSCRTARRSASACLHGSAGFTGGGFAAAGPPTPGVRTRGGRGRPSAPAIPCGGR